MKQNQTLLGRNFDGLSRQQLLIYARELGRHFRKEQDLQSALSERERQLRYLAAASIAAQEEERQLIAYEVHDRIGQTLVAVFYQLQGLEYISRIDPNAQRVLDRASALLSEAISQPRDIMNDLHPPALDEFGIVPLIEKELSSFQEDTGCQTRLDADYRVRPSRDVEVGLYRIFCEALINVRRHAPSAQNLAVSLTSRNQEVSLRIQDDGSGFDIEAATRCKRVGGLISMRRRAEIIGGILRVTSMPNQGTGITIIVPLNGYNGEAGVTSDMDDVIRGNHEVPL